MHYVILSEGSYSDYTPKYFVGEKEITQEELTEKAKSVGDQIIAEYEALPERPHKPTFSFDKETTEKYDPTTNEVVNTYEHGDIWRKRMVEWLTSLGFEELPNGIPEINIEYSDIPHN